MAGTRVDPDGAVLSAYALGVVCGALGSSLIWYAWTR